MKKTISYLIFLHISLLLFGQNNFREGYIITNDSDTIPGLIEYQGDIANSMKCTFKLSDSLKTTVYKPTDIFGYKFIGDKFYISHKINIKNKSEERFLELLVDGVIDLYSIRDINGIRYYMHKPDFDIIELKQTKSEININGKIYQTTKKEYIDSLTYLFSDAPALQKNIDNVALNRKSLISITEDYHNTVCKDYSCIVYEKKLPGFKIRFGILAGSNSVTLSNEVFYITGLDYFDGYTFYCDFDKSVNPVGGIFINIPFPYSLRKFSFQYEALITKNMYSSYSVGNRFSDTVNFSIDYLTLYNNFLIRYDISNWKFRPFLMLGGTINPNFNVKYKGPEKYDAFNKSTSIGFMGGFGFVFKLDEKRELFINLLFTKNYGPLNSFNSDELSFRIGFPIIAN